MSHRARPPADDRSAGPRDAQPAGVARPPAEPSDPTAPAPRSGRRAPSIPIARRAPDRAAPPPAATPPASVWDDEELSFDSSAAEEARRALFEEHLAADVLVRETPAAPAGPTPHVTAVLVAHNGERWLPATLAAVRVQTRAPDRFVGVDTGSSDGSARLLDAALGADGVVRTAETSSYGQAIDGALAAAARPTLTAGQRDWVWLLHDDGAPDPDALERLLDHAARDPEVSVLGAKAVDWVWTDRLVDIGQSTDAAGRRETFLEPGELDQGQHEQPRDVLAVGTAGALVRRETWDALKGFDPSLPLLREDIDFGWRAVRSGRRVAVVPAARVRHARATLTGQRDGALVDGLGRTDRAHALYVSVVDGGGWGGLLRLPRLAVGVLLRALVLLVTRRVVEAYEEIRAGLDVLLRPGRLLAGRRWRHGQLTRPPRAARPLLSRGSTRLRALLLATSDRLAGPGDLVVATPEDADGVPELRARVVRRALLRPWVALTAVLLVLALVADRHLLHGGALVGGRVLPVSSGASDLWRAYVAGWHDAGAGSVSPASPWLPLLALASLPFGGNPAVVITVLLLGAVPLAGLSAWRATSGWGLATSVRWWGAATFALLPPVTGAVDTGRFDALVGVLALPMLAAAAVRVLRAELPAHRAYALGLGLAAAAAFSPPVWTLAAVVMAGWVALAVPAGLIARQPRDALLRTVAGRLLPAVRVLVVAPFVLLPWSLSLLHHPRALLVGLGGPGGLAAVPDRAVGTVDVLFLRPGGHVVPAWVVLPVLVAAVVGCLRPARAGAAALAWAVATVGMLLGLLAARVGATPTGHAPSGWSGVGLGLAATAMLAAALLAAHGGRRALDASSFGVRQPAAVVVTAIAVAVPLLAAGHLVATGSGRPLHREHGSVLPAVVVDDAAADPGQRVLTLRPSGGRVGYSLTPVAGARLGDEDLRADPATSALVARLVADLGSSRGTDAAEALSTFHVRFVDLDAPEGDPMAAVLDRQPELSRFALPGSAQLWRVLLPSSRLELLGGTVAAAALAPASTSADLGRGPQPEQFGTDPITRLRSGAEGADVVVPPGLNGRVVVLADSANPRWHASLDGTRLTPVTAWGWAQAFRMPSVGGRLELAYAAGNRHLELWLQALSVALVLVLAGPGARRGEDDATGLATVPADEAAVPVVAVPVVAVPADRPADVVAQRPADRPPAVRPQPAGSDAAARAEEQAAAALERLRAQRRRPGPRHRRRP